MSMSLDLLPTLNEGDEHVSLGDLLAIRDNCLTELELWAVCKECCLAIQGVHISSDMFQTLCITPDSLAFDQSGTVFFLDLYTDPEPMYVPPEYESVGNSYKAHLYSLGMTLLFAAEYNVALESSRPFSTDLGHTINKMTLDDFDERASLAFVLDMCSKHLEGNESDCVCQKIVSIAQSDTSMDDDRLSSEVDELLPLEMYHHSNQGTPTTKSRSNHHQTASSTSSIESPPFSSLDPTQDETNASSSLHIPPYSPSMHKYEISASTDSRKRTSPIEDIVSYNHSSSSIIVVRPGDRDPESCIDEEISGTANLLLHPNQIVSSDSDGGAVIVYTDGDKAEEVVVTPRKIMRKSGLISPLKKRDPLEAILGSSIIEESHKYATNEDFQAAASLEDITFLSYIEPPLSNDLDLKQWDMIFPLPPPLSTQPQSANADEAGAINQPQTLSNSTSADPSFDEDIINVSPINSPVSLVKTTDGDSNGIKETVNTPLSVVVNVPPGESFQEEQDSITSCEASPIHPLFSTPVKDTIKKVIDQVIDKENHQPNSDNDEHTHKENNIKHTFEENGDLNTNVNTLVKMSPLNDNPSSEININETTNKKCSDQSVQSIESSTKGEDEGVLNTSNNTISTTTRTLTSPQSSSTKEKVWTENLDNNNKGIDLKEEGLEVYGNKNKEKPQPSSSVEPKILESVVSNGGNLVLESRNTNFSRSEVLDNDSANLSNDTSLAKEKSSLIINKSLVDNNNGDESVIVTNNISITSITSTGSGTVKFNAVFGKHVHRDTSQDTLSLAHALDICNSNTSSSVDSTSDSVTKSVTTEILENTVGNYNGLKHATDQQDDSNIAKAILNKEVIDSKLTTDDDVFLSGDLNAHNNENGGDGSKVKNGEKIMSSVVLLGEENNTADMTSRSTTLLRKRSRERTGSNDEGQSVMQVLERLGCCLHENEVWALCRECVLSMQRNRLQLPAYVSLETVVIEDTGRVTYKAVPEDKELEVVFLAPELQQFGIVTEKTCLFGVAAMLWSAADYRLPANQEPALSVDLENLLISMTQDDNDLRPTAIEVLQTCNEFQKKQNTTSTHICQSLAAEARKALAFGKENSLVQNIIDEKFEHEVKTQKAEVSKMIIRDQVTLKPASDRPVVEVVKEKSLHENLMEHIQKPARKLRKSSKPKIQAVNDIFVNNKELMELLKRITRTQKSLPDELPENLGSSAFNVISKEGSENNVNGSQGSIPDEFQSAATHFSPIVLSGSEKKPATSTQDTQKTKTVIDEKQMNEKIKKLKKNLLKNRPPLTLVADLEKDVMQQENTATNQEPIKQLTPPSPYNVNLVSPNPTVMSSPGITMMPPSPAAMHQFQGQYFHGQVPLSTSVPNLAYQYAPMAPAPMPYGMQMQLQQDPRTGLFQLVPVATPMPVAVQPGMYPASSLNQLNGTNPGQYPTLQGYNLSPINQLDKTSRSFSPPSGSSTDGEKPEKRRYRKKHHKQLAEGSSINNRHSDSDSGSKSSNINSNGSGFRTNSNNNRHEYDHEVDSHLNNGAGHHGNSSKLELSPVLELRAPVPRASSVDLLERYENGNSQGPRTPRNVKMKNIKNKIKRAKSGSSLDFKNLAMDNNNKEKLKTYEIYDDSGIEYSGKNISSHLSKSQPSLIDSVLTTPSELTTHSNKVMNHRSRAQRRKTDPASPELPSPPLSPSLSKDSGVSGMNVKTSDMSLMERLLNSDTIRHQQKLSRVVRIVRDEFAYDGYMENGIEDLAMAEYIMSLGNLKWDTFYNAVTEKYCDLYFEEDIMTSLYEAVNGSKPAPEKKLSRGNVQRLSGNTATVISIDEPQHKIECIQRNSLNNSESPSAFRPIHGDHHHESSQQNNHSPSDNNNVLKPKPSKYKKSDYADEGRNRFAKKAGGYYPRNSSLERNRSSSLHDLLLDDEEKKGSLLLESSLKSRSQEDLLDHSELITTDAAGLRSRNNNNTKVSKPPRKNIVSSTSVQNNMHQQTQRTQNDLNNESDDRYYGNDDLEISTDYEHLSKLSYLIRQDSDTSSSTMSDNRGHKHQRSCLTNGVSPLYNTSNSGQHYVRREDSNSSAELSGSSSYTGKYRFSSETILSTESADSEEPIAQSTAVTLKTYQEVTRVGRGSVVYYSAEMETRLRSDVKDMAAQIDVKTRECIESKMAEIEQQMTMEHRNKKKTLKYYRKLVEASKTGKVTNENKVLMNKVGKQVEESNKRLDFLDSAKKHLEMLHAEQWGLDQTLLYALANCPGDTAMLLCACDNPTLQFQVLRSPRLGIEGQFLQAGTPEGLLSYLFAQHALSEGYIHQFFYCYRYFTTSHHVYRFLYDKITASTLSLGPDAEVPSKVKARAIDMLQVWIEGYYTVDFKYDPELMEGFTNFVQKKILPVDETAELIIDVIDRCKAGRHRDLYYQDFIGTREETNNNTPEEAPIKKDAPDNANQWESFKMALKLSTPKPMPKQSHSNKLSTTSAKSESNLMSGVMSSNSGGIKRSSSFNLVECTPQAVAEQLTLVQQELFHQTHPVHYLNSKWLGISVALTNPVMQKTQSSQRLSDTWEGEGVSLFASDLQGQDIILQLVEHAQSVAYWATAEVVSSTSTKTQTAVLNKLINVAKHCQEARNFATCIAIVDGLENLIVRQLAAWKGLSSKCVSAMEELSSLKLFLKSDSLCLLQDKSKRNCPTIPSILYFLLHVQQLEIGGFSLANGMARWSKMKAIAGTIDQIRVFKQHPYTYTQDTELQQSILNRIENLSSQDLHALAQNTATLPNKISSSGRLSNAFKKMSRKMKGNADS